MRFTFFAVSAMLAALASSVALDAEAETQNFEEEYSREDLMEAADQLKQILGIPDQNEQLTEQGELDTQAALAPAPTAAAAPTPATAPTPTPAGKVPVATTDAAHAAAIAAAQAKLKAKTAPTPPPAPTPVAGATDKQKIDVEKAEKQAAEEVEAAKKRALGLERDKVKMISEP